MGGGLTKNARFIQKVLLMAQATALMVNTPSNSKPALASRRFLPLPAVIFMIVVTQIPLLLTLRYSLERWNLLRPERRAFLGIDNYLKIITDNDFRVVVLNTLLLTANVVVFTLVLGMILALLLNRDFFGRNVVRTLLITPFLLMPTVSAVLWKNVIF